LSASNFVLPQFLELKINNMTTFPQDLHISFKKGLNVIFGGNYSGKTTIVNSIRFGVFGLSWGQAIEGVEKRYFSSRVREIERKSLDISTVYHIKPRTVAVHRTVFSSGTAEIEARVSKGSSESLSVLAESVNREKQYYDGLRRHMGLIADEQLKFIPSLIFADENRQPILWSKNLEDFALSLLTSSENIDRLRWIESQLSKTKKDLDRLQLQKDRIIRKNLDNERIEKFLKDSLRKIEEMEMDEYTQEYSRINLEMQECKNRSAQINDALQTGLIQRSDLLSKLNNDQKAIVDLKAKSEQLEEEFIKAILNPSSPEECHLSRYLYYEKKCPFCLASLSEEINIRLEEKKCLLCGHGALMEYEGDTEEIKRKISILDEERKKLIRLDNKIQTDLDKINDEIERITKSREEEHIKEVALSARIDDLKGIEEDLHRKKVMSRELEEMREQINDNKKLIIETDENIKAVTTEIDKINQLYDETKVAIRTEIDLVLTEVRDRFSSFIDLATNGEVSGDLSPDFIPILNGRTIFYPEFASQFERTIMDYAFRIALLSVFAEKTKTSPSLVIETPDEVTDESYISYIAKAILNFSSNLSIIITTFNTEIMKQLLSKYKPRDRKKRLLNLVSKGTLTQRKFYQIPLSEYLSERS